MFSVLAAAAAALVLCACGETKENTGKEPADEVVYVTATPTSKVYSLPEYTSTPTPEITPDTYEDLKEFFRPSTTLDKKLGKFYRQVFDDSYITMGNTCRLKQKLEKARAGEEITVLFIGGSVTEGANATEKTPKNLRKGYAYITYEYLRDTYGVGDGSNVKYVNVGISGTGSNLGMVRVQKDILDHKPDIVFVEFAVNNSTDVYDRETYESLLRRVLKSETEPAVFLLFSAATYAGAAQNYMLGDGQLYDLPMISMQDGLKTVQALKIITWSDFSGDNVHPAQDGHYLYARCICRVIDKIFEEGTDESYTVPEETTVTGFDCFENAVELENNDEKGFIVQTGCFEPKHTTFYATNMSDTCAFENGWVKSKSTSGKDAPMTVKVKCRNFSIVVKQINASAEASVDVYVDGVKKKTIVTSKPGAWNNAETFLIFTREEAEEHVFEIRTNSTSEDSEVTILAMSYTE